MRECFPHASVAQWIERLPPEQKAESSSLPRRILTLVSVLEANAFRRGLFHVIHYLLFFSRSRAISASNLANCASCHSVCVTVAAR